MESTQQDNVLKRPIKGVPDSPGGVGAGGFTYVKLRDLTAIARDIQAQQVK